MPARRKHTNELKGMIMHLEHILHNVSNGICDSSSIGKLELMLANAHIPMEYRDIFYKMFAMTRNAKACKYNANTLNLDFIYHNQNDLDMGGGKLTLA